MSLCDWNPEMTSAAATMVMRLNSLMPLPRFTHVDVKLEELLQPFRVVTEVAADVDALENLVVTLMRCAEILRHLRGIVEFGDRRREVRLAREQNVLGAGGEVGSVLLRQVGTGKVFQPSVFEYLKSVFSLPQTVADPNQMQARGDQGHVPEGASYRA